MLNFYIKELLEAHPTLRPDSHLLLNTPDDLFVTLTVKLRSYQVISLLSTTYNTSSTIILSFLAPCVVTFTEDYQ
jgi:hypothetical protein